ncbi:TIGR00725 family protein [Thermaerobacter sp. FW80]|nr:TIGR00725 family protein [Thermaerobacter sp. FW80]
MAVRGDDRQDHDPSATAVRPAAPAPLDGPPLRVAVIGDSGAIPPSLRDAARAVGAALARQGAVVLTGGRDGVMAAVCQGAWEAGGLTVGILPGDDPREGNAWLHVPLTTGLGMEWRSMVLIHAADSVVMMGGGNGTLAELSAAYLNGRPVVILAGSGGWSDRIRQVLVEGRYLDGRRTVAVEFATTPEQAAGRALALARQFRQRHFPGPARWRGLGEAGGGAGDVVTPA